MRRLPGPGTSVDLVGVGADATLALERADRRDLVARELEVEDVEVLRHALAPVRLREDDVPGLQVPADDDRRLRPAASRTAGTCPGRAGPTPRSRSRARARTRSPAAAGAPGGVRSG